MGLMLSCTAALVEDDEPPVAETNITMAQLPVGDLGNGYRRPATGFINPDVDVNGERIENLSSFATVQQFCLPQGLPQAHWDTISATGLFQGGNRTVVTSRAAALVFNPSLQLVGQPYLVSSWTLPMNDVGDQFVIGEIYAVTITWS